MTFAVTLSGCDAYVTGTASVCGNVWITNEQTVYCKNGYVAYDALLKFKDLKSITLERAVVLPGSLPISLDKLQLLGIDTMTVPEWFMRRMPNLRTAWITNSTFDPFWFSYTPKLENLSFFGGHVSRPEALAALPMLKRLDLAAVDGGAGVKRYMNKIRPDVEVRIFHPAPDDN